MSEFLGPLVTHDQAVGSSRRVKKGAARIQRQNPYIDPKDPSTFLAERGDKHHGVNAFATDFEWVLALDAGDSSSMSFVERLAPTDAVCR